MSTLQGIGVLPDGTYINTTGDEYADILYEIIRAEHDGEISAEEAYKRKDDLAAQISKDKYSEDTEKQDREYKDRRDVFMSRDYSYYQITDITERLEELMKKEATKARLLLSFFQQPLNGELTSFKTTKMFFWFKNNGKYDLKKWDEFQEHSLYIYNGEILSRDALGNIFYGYLGSACGISYDYLHIGAGAQQVYDDLKRDGIKKEWYKTFFDDPRDYQRVQEGINQYKIDSENRSFWSLY